MGAAFLVIDRINTRVYYEELTQQLNAPIAMYVTEQRNLIANGAPDAESLAELARHAMVINPSAEIYLLDVSGKILGHALAEESVTQSTVDLTPIRSLLGGTVEMPIRGDDPRSTMQKVFSAAEVTNNGVLEGYLYVVLGGQTYEALATNIAASYVGRASTLAIICLIALTAAIGLLVFGLMTKRLRQLNHEMMDVTESKFETIPTITATTTTGDEIDQLTHSFINMATQIRTQLSQLTENDKLRRELVSNISHDLRTPLSAMQGYLETLILKGDQLSDGERARYLSVARKHATRLGTLIGDLFELSKLDSASVTPNIENFSLPELVQDVALEFQLDAEKKGIAVEIQTNTEFAFTRGDIGLIQRVLENLMRNAIRFTPNGGTITLSISDRSQGIVVSVADTGSGIPKKDLSRIFDRFYRSVEGEEARSESAGLGLAIVKRILDLHNSRITVESELDRGTRFEFELPSLKAAA